MAVPRCKLSDAVWQGRTASTFERLSLSEPVDMNEPTGLFKQQSATLRPVIEHELTRLASFGEGCPSRLQAAIHHSLLAPGKRLRPLLVLSSAEACGSDYKVALPAACAIEMVHTYSLIHDDLPAMDDDDLRRGRPSCHAAFDEATAILAGDALLARAFEVLGQEMAPSIAARCCVELAHAAGATQMVGGQADDLAAENAKHPIHVERQASLAQLEAIHRRKTGAMLTASLRLGAIAAEASNEQLNRLTTYGKRIGLAFQIVDDLLDTVGQQQAIGKRTGQDSSRGKLTFPGLLGVEASRDRAAALVAEAVEAVQDGFGDQATQLISLAHFVLERNR